MIAIDCLRKESMPLQKCEACRKELIDGQCRNDKCRINKAKMKKVEQRHHLLVINPNFRKAFLRDKIKEARAVYGPEAPKVKELEAELAREVRYHG